eukprot:3542952-Amphidinium_carterae.1
MATESVRRPKEKGLVWPKKQGRISPFRRSSSIYVFVGQAEREGQSYMRQTPALRRKELELQTAEHRLEWTSLLSHP